MAAADWNCDPVWVVIGGGGTCSAASPTVAGAVAERPIKLSKVG